MSAAPLQGSVLRGVALGILLILTLGILAGMVADVAIMPLYTRQGSERPVPDVLGLSVEQARRVADSLGFRITEEAAQLGGRVAPGTILEQRPVAGSLAKPGRKIRVVPAREGVASQIPDLTGMDLRDAEIQCRNLGLVVAPSGTSYDFSAVVPKGGIMRQRPEPGAPVRDGEHVQLVVSLGPRPAAILVPSLLELSLHEARQLLIESGLQVGRISRKETDLYFAGTVIAQSLHSGEEVEQNTQVDLVVAVPVRVPSAAEPGDEASPEAN